MSDNELHIDLRCSSCGWELEHNRAAVDARLRAAGLLKRNAHPSLEELRELLFGVAKRLPCPECGHVGLEARDAPEVEADWPGAVRCRQCKALIPPERLEIFPNATLCVTCQRGDERGVSPDEPEYCPHCGTPMVVRPTRGAGIRRYVQVCPSCS